MEASFHSNTVRVAGSLTKLSNRERSYTWMGDPACLPIFKIAGPVRTNLDQDTDKKIFFLLSNGQKFSPKIDYQMSDFAHKFHAAL